MSDFSDDEEEGFVKINSLESILVKLNIIQELKERIEFLENENKEMKKILSNLKDSQLCSSKLKFTDILNERSQPSITYDEWINAILNMVESKLNTVFENDLLTGINLLLKDSIECLNNPPIIAFQKKLNTFYYFTNDNNWVLLEDSEFDKLLKKIDYRFLVEFNRCWYQENIHKIQHIDEYKNMYVSYHLKILGGNKMSDELRYKKIRQTFYNVIKESL